MDLTLLLLLSAGVIDSCVSVCGLCSTDSENAIENGPPSTIQLRYENRSVASIHFVRYLHCNKMWRRLLLKANN